MAPSAPYDRLVFRKLVAFSGLHPILALVLLPAVICCGFFVAEWQAATAWFLGGYAFLLMLYAGANRLRYQYRFVGWQERLPFQLTGWNELIHQKKMYCDLCWTDLRIEIFTSADSPELTALTKAALTIFLKKSRKAFYTARAGTSDRYREDWKVLSPTLATGSANPEVMRYLKNLLEGELATIARKTGQLSEVRIHTASEEFEVKIEISTGNT